MPDGRRKFMICASRRAKRSGMESGMEEKKTIIEVKGLEKAYKLYDKPSDRLKEALGLGRKKRYKEHYALKGVDLSVSTMA